MMLDFNNIGAIEKYGFLGFKKLSDVFNNNSSIPDIKGIYMILYTDPNTPEFLITGTGGHFKGRNPNISMQALKYNWIEDTIYINKSIKLLKIFIWVKNERFVTIYKSI